MNGTLLTVIAQEAPGPVKPSIFLVTCSGLIALSAVIAMWALTVHVVTIAHEGGHALFTSAFGGRVVEVRLNRDGTGSTLPAGLVKEGVGDFFASLAGYLGPSFFGLVGAILLVEGRVKPMLWLGLVFLALMLALTVNPFGWISLILSGMIVFFIARDGTDNTQLWFAYIWVWFLLIGGFWDIMVLPPAEKVTDVQHLRRIALLPGDFWVALFWLASLAALAFGAAILLGLVVEPVDWAGVS